MKQNTTCKCCEVCEISVCDRILFVESTHDFWANLRGYKVSYENTYRFLLKKVTFLYLQRKVEIQKRMVIYN